MSTAPPRVKRVKVELHVPEEVREWLDRRATAVYKSRSRYGGDLLINLYHKDPAVREQ